MKKHLWALVFGLIGVSLAHAQGTRLLRQPTISDTHVTFVYANDLWTVPRTGGNARRLTSHPGAESTPRFSPDGRVIAFTGQYDGNIDVYLVDAQGGTPRRLTYHPDGDGVRGWDRHGRRVLFASGRASAPVGFTRLWTISIDGGMPEQVPMPMANKGDYSPDGRRMAYGPINEAFSAWRHYRGGRTTPIWLIDLDDYSLEKIPRENSNDTDPMWIGTRVYFLSDRAGTMNLFSYDLRTGRVEQLTEYDDHDIKSASAGGDTIVFEQAGYLHQFDLPTRTVKQMEVHVRGDLPWARPHFENVGSQIRSGDLSPSGARAVFEARGDIFTVPREKGSVRNITNSPGVHDRFPVWSPDGRRIAWFSDAGGEYQLMIGDRTGMEEPRSIKFDEPSFYYTPAWSPDSTKIALTDKHLNLWTVDVESGEATLVDTDTYSHPQRTIDPAWSPDSKWLAYALRLDSQLHAIYLYSVEEAKSYQVTDGLSDAVSPAFDRNGKYLYFLASTDFALNTGWLDLSSYDTRVQRGVYLVVLDSEEPSPFLPESDDEEVDEEVDEEDDEKSDESDKDETEEDEATVEGEGEKPADETPDEQEGDDDEDEDSEDIKVDLEGIDQRILTVGVPVRRYGRLAPGPKGHIFYSESVDNEPGLRLHRYSIEKREAKQFMTGVGGFGLNADGKKVLVAKGGQWIITDATGDAPANEKTLNVAAMRAKVDPRAEWKQIYHAGWRINRDFFYDPEMHDTDWKKVYDKYRPWVDHVGHRSDLTYLLSMLIGELVVGHAYVGGGDTPSVDSVSVGLLGADLEIDRGRFRFKRIYTGENWNPNLRAPLTMPGVKVSDGDYLLKVGNTELTGDMNPYGLFEATADQQTVLTVNSEPTLDDARTVTVVPITNERALRSRAWVEDNRRKVDELSDGRLAYVYLPNTAGSGYTYFNRYYFAQLGRRGAVLDERFNGGGFAADYIIDLLDRPVLNYWATRDGKTFITPTAAIFGPKVMIINEYAGSGGDAMPYYFRKRKIGPLVGKTTWGGLVGIYDYPQLIDGGFITAPRVAFYDTDGKWDVENIGVAPDIEVEYDPATVIAGRDPQLEKAVETALEMLEAYPAPSAPRPAPPTDRTDWQKK